jgi:hypothetical protein
MGLSRRIDVRLGPELFALIESFALANGLGLGAAARLLLSRGLDLESGRGGTLGSAPALAALVAAEHAVLMVASILPEGEQRMRALAGRATESAEERLAAFREQPAAPEEGSR